eukprot:2763462-Amphidinium_carterae.1
MVWCNSVLLLVLSLEENIVLHGLFDLLFVNDVLRFACRTGRLCRKNSYSLLTNIDNYKPVKTNMYVASKRACMIDGIAVVLLQMRQLGYSGSLGVSLIWIAACMQRLLLICYFRSNCVTGCLISKAIQWKEMVSATGKRM